MYLACRRELSTWWFHLHRALSVVGLVLAIAGAATGGGLTTDDYHQSGGGSAHKALGGLTVAAAAIQVTVIRYNTFWSAQARNGSEQVLVLALHSQELFHVNTWQTRS